MKVTFQELSKSIQRRQLALGLFQSWVPEDGNPVSKHSLWTN